MADVVVDGTPLKDTGKPVPVKAFKLLDGKQHMHDNVDLKAGEVVYLNENQAKAFKDKFAPVDAAAPFKVYTSDEMAKLVEAESVRRADVEEKSKR